MNMNREAHRRQLRREVAGQPLTWYMASVAVMVLVYCLKHLFHMPAYPVPERLEQGIATPPESASEKTKRKKVGVAQPCGKERACASTH